MSKTNKQTKQNQRHGNKEQMTVTRGEGVRETRGMKGKGIGNIGEGMWITDMDNRVGTD